jgi:putative tryptophan/tyrosine transport system substrate-binding protein
MRRREFICLLGGAAAPGPHAAIAQQTQPVRRIGILLSLSPDPELQTWVDAFLQTLAGWARGNPAEVRRNAAELVALAPDVILAHGASVLGPLLQATRTVPVVFPIASDPVGSGFVESLARPGGNATGFLSTEFSMAAKWLELLKEIAPSVTRVAVLRDATQGPEWVGSLLFRLPPHRFAWRLLPSICAMRAKSNGAWRLLRGRPAAVWSSQADLALRVTAI